MKTTPIMRHLYSWIAVCGFCFATPQLFAQFQYFTNASSVTIDGYTGPGGALVIPAAINGLPVTSIAPNAFSTAYSSEGANPGLIRSLAVPDSVTNIGSSAFESCVNLTNITLGTNLINLGDNAFSYCGKLASITLPRSLTNLGEFAFYYCSNLTAIAVDPQNPVYSSADGVLFDKAQKTLLQFPGGKEGSYTIPGSVTNIGSGALWNCVNLTNISIPSSVLAMQQGAFSGCANLTNITVDTQNPNYSSAGGVLFDKAQTTLLQYPEGRAGSYVIPKSITSVGDVAFSFCNGLTNVTIPASVTSIGAYAFEDCSALAGLFFAGNTPTNLGSNPFFSDTSATVYYLPGTTGWETFSGPPTVLWNPAIQMADDAFGVRSNQFGFTIVGTANIPIVVKICTGLAGAAWSPVLSCNLTNGSIYFADAAWTNYPARFYGIGFP